MPRRPDRPKPPPRPGANRGDAYLTGLRMLARRELFAGQLRDRLQRKGYPDDDIEEALGRLRAEGALDDDRAAAAFAHDAAHLKHRGRQRTEQELTRLGVGPAQTRAALDAAYGKGDDPARLERALARRLRGPIDGPAEYRRLYRALRRQGFEGELIATALRPHLASAARRVDDEAV